MIRHIAFGYGPFGLLLFDGVQRLWYFSMGVNGNQSGAYAMEKRCVQADGAPPAMGPYSHAVAAGGLLFLSGQGPLAPDGSGVVRGTIEEETRLTFSNIQAVLKASGATLADVVKVLVFLEDMDQFAAFNVVYQEYFPENPPARSCIQAGRLPGDMHVEIEVVALLPES